MSLRIVKWKNVIQQCGRDQKMLKAFQRFYLIAKIADWRTPQEVVRTFNYTDLVTCKKQSTSRIVFNIGQNKYRLIVGYYFAKNHTILYVKFVGSHKEYDLVDVCTVDMFKMKK